MKALAAVARLELERGVLVLPLALAVGCMPFAVVPLWGAPADAARALAMALALVLAAATAFLLGGTAVAGDLAAGRLGFYFSRPLPWWSIWGGKLGAAALLTLAAAGLVLVPALLFSDGRWPHPPLAIIAWFVLSLIGLSHWWSTVVRSRSPWLLLDGIALALVAWGLGDALEHIFQERGFMPMPLGLALLLAPVAVAIHAAGALLVAEGRTSMRRAHAAGSLTGWLSLALIAGGWQLASRTLFAPGVARLADARVLMSASDGGTAWFTGGARVRGFRAWKAEDAWVASPRGTRAIEPPSGWAAGFAFSGDASRVLLLRGTADRDELQQLDVASGATHTVVLTPPLSPTPPHVRRTLADERGERVALLQAGWTSLYDARSGARLALLEDGSSGPVGYLAFREGRSALLYRTPPDGSLGIEELAGEAAIPSGRVAPPRDGGWRGLHLDAAGERLLATARGEARLADARTGETLAAFEGEAAALFEGLLLSDGRVLVVAPEGAATPARLYDAAGTRLGELDLGAASAVHLVEARPGRVVASISSAAGERLLAIDLDLLRLARVDEGLAWNPPLGPGFPSRRDRPAGESLLATRVEAWSGGWRSSVLRYDVETGRTQLVAGAR